MICTSWAWPNLFDVARNKVGLYSDAKSITNRVKLLMLTEPTEMYLSPNFGVGLKKFLFIYNSENVPAMIKDALVEQLKLWEPSVVPEETVVTSGTEHSQSSSSTSQNSLNLTVTLKTRYGQSLSFSITDEDIVNAKN